MIPFIRRFGVSGNQRDADYLESARPLPGPGVSLTMQGAVIHHRRHRKLNQPFPFRCLKTGQHTVSVDAGKIWRVGAKLPWQALSGITIPSVVGTYYVYAYRATSGAATASMGVLPESGSPHWIFGELENDWLHYPIARVTVADNTETPPDQVITTIEQIQFGDILTDLMLVDSEFSAGSNRTETIARHAADQHVGALTLANMPTTGNYICGVNNGVLTWYPVVVTNIITGTTLNLPQI